MPEEFLTFTIPQLASLFQARKLSPVEVTKACLDRIERLNDSLNAYVTILPDQALELAREAERAWHRREARSLLQGVPLSLKDVFETKGVRTTWGSEYLADYHPNEDSTVADKLRQSGAVLLGKVNADINPHPGETRRIRGATRNPWNPAHPAGYSSGGSAAAVAALLDYGSIGSDTSGSIRLPAAYCGVVGLKPTFGRVSKFRVFPYSESFDHCGPLARNTFDCALLLKAIAGRDDKDFATHDIPVPDYTSRLGQGVRGLRVGVPWAALKHSEPDVSKRFSEAVEVLNDLGMELREIELPHLHDDWWLIVVSVLEVTAMSDGEFSPDARDSYAAYMRVKARAAQQRLLDQGRNVQRVVETAYAKILRDLDLIVTPTAPTTASGIAALAKVGDEDSAMFMERYSDRPGSYSRIFSFIRYPAISVPCGFASDGMPVGLQIVGRPFEEEMVLRASHAYEQATTWYLKHPTFDSI